MAEAQLERVSDEEPEAAEAAEPTLADLQAELAARDKQIAELRLETEKRVNAETKARDEFWAKRGGPPAAIAATPRAEADDDPLNELDWLPALTEETDPAKIKSKINAKVRESIRYQLKKGGYVSADEVDAKINALITSVTNVQKLAQEFPLADKDFQAEMQRQIGILDNDPANKGLPEAALHRMAAIQAENVLLKSGKGGQIDAEGDRSERIARQRGGSRGYSKADTGATLTADERAMAARMGVTEKDYLAQKQAMRLGPGLTADRLTRELANG